MFIKLHARVRQDGLQECCLLLRSGFRGSFLAPLAAFFLPWNTFWRVRLHVFDDGFYLIQSKICRSFLFFLWKLIVAQSLLDIRTIGATKQLYLFLFENLDGTLFFSRSFLYDHGCSHFITDRIGFELFPQGVELPVMCDIGAEATDIDSHV